VPETANRDNSLRTLPKLLSEMTKRHPRRVALREKELGIWREYTWGEYFEHVTNCAFGLLELGLEVGSKIAILADNNPRWLFADMGIQMAQGITVGIYPTSSGTETYHEGQRGEILYRRRSGTTR
jgi:long-chain acyl-CoA synthetase